MLIFSISDGDRENTALIEAVYRNGKFLGSSWWQVRSILLFWSRESEQVVAESAHTT